MSLASLLNDNTHLTLTENNRVRCQITGHEMPAEYNAVEGYLKNSRKLKKMKEWYTHDYSKYLPYIVEHKKDSKKLFCRLTKTKLNRIPDEVEKHWKGKRFQRLKKEYDEKISQRKRKRSSNEVEGDPDGVDEEDESLRYLEDLLGNEAFDSDQGSDNEEELDEDVEEDSSDKDSMTDLIGSDHENDDDFILRRVKPALSKKRAKESKNGRHSDGTDKRSGETHSAERPSKLIKSGGKKPLRKAISSKLARK